MKKLILAGAALAAIVAVPTIAQNAGRPDRNAAVTRADVEGRVRTMFERLDADKDGFVTQDETKAARAGARVKMHEAMFARLDANKDGSISRAEFDAPRANAGERAGHDGKRGHRRMAHNGMAGGFGGGRMLARADADKDGRVSLAEATTPALQRFDRADADHDGTLTPEERKAARETMRAQWKQRQG